AHVTFAGSGELVVQVAGRAVGEVRRVRADGARDELEPLLLGIDVRLDDNAFVQRVADDVGRMFGILGAGIGDVDVLAALDVAVHAQVGKAVRPDAVQGPRALVPRLGQRPAVLADRIEADALGVERARRIETRRVHDAVDRVFGA